MKSIQIWWTYSYLVDEQKTVSKKKVPHRLQSQGSDNSSGKTEKKQKKRKNQKVNDHWEFSTRGRMLYETTLASYINNLHFHGNRFVFT